MQKKNKKKYIIALDQGTTNSRAIIIDHNSNIIAQSQREIKQIYPKPGWVEHDPIEIWNSQFNALTEVINTNNINQEEIAAIGITNQRETTIIWDKYTGKPIYNAIVWQDTRTTDYCNYLIKQGLTKHIKKTNGLIINPYFSATKVQWILKNINGAQKKAENGDLLFGNVDSWLVWNLTKGKIHITDYTNASRTMMFNIHTLQWDQYILKILNIPNKILPEVKPSSYIYSYININKNKNILIPITGIAGDQQAALYGQLCVYPGMAKNTYGTGCFMLMNTGTKAINSNTGLLTTIVCGAKGEVNYALEGSVFIGGALIQWLKDEIKLINDVKDSEYFALKVKDNNGVYIVPAFTGLGSPYWDPYARGAIFGLTRGVNSNHIIRAALESIAWQTCDILKAMQKDAKTQIKSLRVDGGVVENNFLMQFQADIIKIIIERLNTKEITALGVSWLAGLAVKFWDNLEELKSKIIIEKTFFPNMDNIKRNNMYKQWKKAIKYSKKWNKQ